MLNSFVTKCIRFVGNMTQKLVLEANSWAKEKFKANTSMITKAPMHERTYNHPAYTHRAKGDGSGASSKCPAGLFSVLLVHFYLTVFLSASSNKNKTLGSITMHSLAGPYFKGRVLFNHLRHKPQYTFFKLLGSKSPRLWKASCLVPGVLPQWNLTTVSRDWWRCQTSLGSKNKENRFHKVPSKLTH